jgi:hypothetical protein
MVDQEGVSELSTLSQMWENKNNILKYFFHFGTKVYVIIWYKLERSCSKHIHKQRTYIFHLELWVKMIRPKKWLGIKLATWLPTTKTSKIGFKWPLNWTCNTVLARHFQGLQTPQSKFMCELWTCKVVKLITWAKKI